LYYRRLKSLLKPNKENLERNIYPQIILVSISIKIYYTKKIYVVKELMIRDTIIQFIVSYIV